MFWWFERPLVAGRELESAAFRWSLDSLAYREHRSVERGRYCIQSVYGGNSKIVYET